jgi:hypothetical protein
VVHGLVCFLQYSATAFTHTFQDGGINPPHWYYSDEEKRVTRHFWTGVADFPPLPPVQVTIPRSAPSQIEQFSPAAGLLAEVNGKHKQYF